MRPGPLSVVPRPRFGAHVVHRPTATASVGAAVATHGSLVKGVHGTAAGKAQRRESAGGASDGGLLGVESIRVLHLKNEKKKEREWDARKVEERTGMWVIGGDEEWHQV